MRTREIREREKEDQERERGHFQYKTIHGCLSEEKRVVFYSHLTSKGRVILLPH